VDILYLDQWLIVINKPTGLLSIQDGYDLSLPHVRTLIEPEYGKCWVVHRLDKETSGVLILSRSEESHRAISVLFQQRKINKTYHAIVYGELDETQRIINLPLLINADRKHRTRIDMVKGKAASTSIELLYSNRIISEVKAMPHTGYTHQIRAHLSSIGHPILGDSLYSSKVSTNFSSELITRLALHSSSIEFLHPFTNEPIKINAPYPSDFLSIRSLIK